jgi:hypothetical protein
MLCTCVLGNCTTADIHSNPGSGSSSMLASLEWGRGVHTQSSNAAADALHCRACSSSCRSVEFCDNVHHASKSDSLLYSRSNRRCDPRECSYTALGLQKCLQLQSCPARANRLPAGLCWCCMPTTASRNPWRTAGASSWESGVHRWAPQCRQLHLQRLMCYAAAANNRTAAPPILPDGIITN